MTDYLRAVLDMIGPPENRYADPAAWARLEADVLCHGVVPDAVALTCDEES
ncbi:hypothetical protein [Streptomyces sp. NPDC005281]|uniref:hypothetical protein n=1 Tax=Streptomyces sp. NPDC005281 TaxID=3155712 RepID=UPI0033A834DA